MLLLYSCLHAVIPSGNGDGILLSGNEIVFRDTRIVGNRVLVAGGGGIYVGDGNAVVVDSCFLGHNVASMDGGGGIRMYTQSTISVSNSVFEANLARTCGGGIESILLNSLTMDGVSMTRNHANSTGGGICLRGGSTMALTGTTRMYRNSAVMLGGGIALLDTPLWQLRNSTDQLILEENLANRGSAAFFTAVTEGGDHSNIIYRNNNATVGGTVFWLKSADMLEEPEGVNSAHVIWEGNEAGYGPMVATQAIDLHGPSVYDATVYSQVLAPPIQLFMTDYYGQFVSDSSSTVFYAICN